MEMQHTFLSSSILVPVGLVFEVTGAIFFESYFYSDIFHTIIVGTGRVGIMGCFSNAFRMHGL